MQHFNHRIQFGIISLFPDMFAALQSGIIGRAIKQGYLELSFWNPRDFVDSTIPGFKYRRVDDRPYGGGPGMVMLAQPLQDAIRAAKKVLGTARVIHLSPQGKVFTQQTAMKLAKETSVILIASRYEGVDERLLEVEVDEEWSIGDYVLTGGELPAMVMIDAVTRFIPGVLGDEESALGDSFVDGLLDYPHYTRPEVFADRRVPPVLLEGHHKAIATWRLKQALGRTWLRRPDLLAKRTLTPQEQQLLNTFISEYQEARGKTDE